MKKILPKISKKKFLTFSVFLITASFFWFLNAFSYEYSANVNYEIEYIGIPESYMSIEKLPKELTVTVKSTGFKLFWLQNQNHKVIVDFNKYGEYDKKDKTKLIFSTSKIRKNLFNDTLQINIQNIEPKNIILNTQKITGKKVPVIPLVKIFCKDLYMQAEELKINPDSITIFAAKDVLSEIRFVETEEMIYNDLDKPVETLIRLKQIENVNFSSDQIQISVPIEKYTENIIKTKIEILNCPENYKIITFPGDVSIKFKVVLSRYDKISYTDFKVVIDFNEIQENKSSKIKVTLSEFPGFISDIIITPEYVEYLTEKMD